MLQALRLRMGWYRALYSLADALPHFRRFALIGATVLFALSYSPNRAVVTFAAEILGHALPVVLCVGAVLPLSNCLLLRDAFARRALAWSTTLVSVVALAASVAAIALWIIGWSKGRSICNPGVPFWVATALTVLGSGWLRARWKD